MLFRFLTSPFTLSLLQSAEKLSRGGSEESPLGRGTPESSLQIMGTPPLKYGSLERAVLKDRLQLPALVCVISSATHTSYPYAAQTLSPWDPTHGTAQTPSPWDPTHGTALPMRPHPWHGQTPSPWPPTPDPVLMGPHPWHSPDPLLQTPYSWDPTHGTAQTPSSRPPTHGTQPMAQPRPPSHGPPPQTAYSWDPTHGTAQTPSPWPSTPDSLLMGPHPWHSPDHLSMALHPRQPTHGMAQPRPPPHGPPPQTAYSWDPTHGTAQTTSPWPSTPDSLLMGPHPWHSPDHLSMAQPRPPPHGPPPPPPPPPPPHLPHGTTRPMGPQNSQPYGFFHISYGTALWIRSTEMGPTIWRTIPSTYQPFDRSSVAPCKLPSLSISCEDLLYFGEPLCNSSAPAYIAHAQPHPYADY